MRLKLVVTLSLAFVTTSVGPAFAGIFASPSLSQRVLHSNELPGFVPDRMQTLAAAEDWAKVAPEALVNVAPSCA